MITMDMIDVARKFSSWNDRSSSLRLILIISLLSNSPSSSDALQTDVCTTGACVRWAAEILRKIDKNVDPCQDFYKFACGNYMKRTVIPDNEMLVDSYTSISDKVNFQLMNLLQEPERDDDPRFSKLVKTIYSSCMNTTKIEREGLSYVKKEFKGFGGWPVIEPSWNETSFDWETLQHRLIKDGWRSNFFINMYVGHNLNNSTQPILTLSQPKLPDVVLKRGLSDTRVRSEYDFMTELAVLFGADRPTAIEDMRDVIDFENNLAKLKTPKDQTEHINNHVTIGELQRNFSRFPWLKLINNYLSPTDMLNSDDVVNVEVPKFFEKLEEFLPNVKKRTLANYMFSRVVRDVVDCLPEAFNRVEHEYMETGDGINGRTPRWKKCVLEAKTLHIAVSSLHVKNLFDERSKDKLMELIGDINSAFLNRLKKSGWMDKKTKKHAIHKLERMGLFVGYPKEILDDKKVDDYYELLQLDSDDSYLKNRLNLWKFNDMKRIQTLRKHDEDWVTHAFTYSVEVDYAVVKNAIELPAAILHGHFYDPDRPQYMNYGSMGQVICHEMTHAFDNIGRQFDKDGNMADWWKPETVRAFKRKSQCFVKQYGNCTVTETGMKLNGVNTLRENIADNGGIKIAYAGYLKWLEKNKPEAMLPALPYNARQLFWITAAMNWCGKFRKEYLEHLVASGQHAPFYFRVLMPFKNSDHFGKDFNCPIGSAMNPEYKCRMW